MKQNSEIQTKACNSWNKLQVRMPSTINVNDIPVCSDLNSKSKTPQLATINSSSLFIHNFDFESLLSSTAEDNTMNLQKHVNSYVVALQQIIKLAKINEMVLAQFLEIEPNQSEHLSSSLLSLKAAMASLDEIPLKKTENIIVNKNIQKAINDVSVNNIDRSLQHIKKIMTHLLTINESEIATLTIETTDLDSKASNKLKKSIERLENLLLLQIKKNNLLNFAEKKTVELQIRINDHIEDANKNIDQIDQWISSSNYQIISEFIQKKKRLLIVEKKNMENILKNISWPNPNNTIIDLNKFIRTIVNREEIIKETTKFNKKIYLFVEKLSKIANTPNDFTKINVLSIVNILLMVFENKTKETGFKYEVVNKVSEFNSIKAMILALDSSNIIETINLDDKILEIQTTIDELKTIQTVILREITNTNYEENAIKIQLAKIINLEGKENAKLIISHLEAKIFWAKWVYFNVVKTTSLFKIDDVIAAASAELEVSEEKLLSMNELLMELDVLPIVNQEKFQKMDLIKALTQTTVNEINEIIEDELKLIRKSIIAESFTEENWNKDFENDFFYQNGIDLLLMKKNFIIDRKLIIEENYKEADALLFDFYAESFIAEKNNLLKTINLKPFPVNLKRTVIKNTLTLLIPKNNSNYDLDPTKTEIKIIKLTKKIIIKQLDIIKNIVFSESWTPDQQNNFSKTINQLQYDSENPRESFIDKLTATISDFDDEDYETQIIISWLKIESAYQKAINIQKVLRTIFNIAFYNQEIKEYEDKITEAKLYQKLTRAQNMAKKAALWLEIATSKKLFEKNFYSPFAENVQQIITKKNEIQKLIENKLVNIMPTFKYFWINHWDSEVDVQLIIDLNSQNSQLSVLIINVTKIFEDMTKLYQDENFPNNVESVIEQIFDSTSTRNDSLLIFTNSQKIILKKIIKTIKIAEKQKENSQINIKLAKIQNYLINLKYSENPKNILKIFIKKIKEFQQIILINKIKTDQAIHKLYLMMGNLAVFDQPSSTEMKTMFTTEIIRNNEEEIIASLAAINQVNIHVEQQIFGLFKQLKLLKFLWNQAYFHSNLTFKQKATMLAWSADEDFSVKKLIDFLGSIFFKAINVANVLGNVKLSWNLWDQIAVDAEYEIHYWSEHLKKDDAVLADAVKLNFESERNGSDPYLQTLIEKTDQTASVVVSGLIPGEWYTFTLQKVGQPTGEFTVNNFDSVYIHNGIKIVLLEIFIQKFFYDPHGIIHARQVNAVVKNEAISNEECVDPCDLTRLRELFFFPDKDEIEIIIANNNQPVGPLFNNSDIINVSIRYYTKSAAHNMAESFKTRFSSSETPLIVISGGNQAEAACSEDAWDYLENGGSMKTSGEFFKTCNTLPLYLIKKKPNYANKNLIIVGSSVEKYANKPGEILQERWISTHFSWIFNSEETDKGTSFGTPYVVKIAAEIKRRAPHYSNSQIADLIFETAYDAGEPGTDAVYGRGILDPLAIFDELTKRGF